MLWVKCSWVFSFPKSSSGSDQRMSHIGPYAGGSLNLSNWEKENIKRKAKGMSGSEETKQLLTGIILAFVLPSWIYKVHIYLNYNWILKSQESGCNNIAVQCCSNSWWYNFYDIIYVEYLTKLSQLMKSTQISGDLYTTVFIYLRNWPHNITTFSTYKILKESNKLQK